MTLILGSTGFADLSSVLSEPLEVAAVILSVSGFHAGLAGALELLRGGDGDEIQAHAATAGATGFIVGVPMSLWAGLYIATF